MISSVYLFTRGVVHVLLLKFGIDKLDFLEIYEVILANYVLIVCFIYALTWNMYESGIYG